MRMLPGFLPLPALVLSLAAHIYDPPPRPSADLLSSDVKISLGMGHGSGTYLGNGYILTANHVIDGAIMLAVQTNAKRTYAAKVIATDPANDMAVVRIDEAAPLAVSKVTCRAPVPGEDVVASGNPYSIEHIRTWGRIAGPARNISLVPSALVLDLTVAPGMSGGAVRDKNNLILGIVTATMLQPGKGSIVHISYSVPTFKFCPLLKQIGVI